MASVVPSVGSGETSPAGGESQKARSGAAIAAVIVTASLLAAVTTRGFTLLPATQGTDSSAAIRDVLILTIRGIAIVLCAVGGYHAVQSWRSLPTHACRARMSMVRNSSDCAAA